MMSDERRFVLDANVLVSAVLMSRGKPRQALDKAQNLGILLMSDAVFLELQDVLLRPKFDRYSTRAKREAFLENLTETVQFVEVTEQIKECRDEKDNKYLELAVSGKAECIITGDDDLLSLNPFRGIAILTVQAFLEKDYSVSQVDEVSRWA